MFFRQVNVHIVKHINTIHNIRGINSRKIIIFEELNPQILLYLQKLCAMIERILYQQLHSDMFNGKAILLFGPRQVGKSTLVNTLLSGVSESKLVLNADDPVVRNIFDNPNVEQLRQIIADNKCIFIDEAQQISEIGRIAKLIVDTFTDIQLILSGSSSFELASATQEPLTGRKRTYFLHPVSWGEWQKYAGYLKAE